MGTDSCRDWSELPADVCSLVLKKLSVTDFARAKTVLSTWYLASKSTSPKENQIPWLIFDQDTYWELFNAEEGRYYRTQNLGRFADCRGLATCGSWFLVIDKEAYFYIFNPFTLEIIHLPPLESNRSTTFSRRGNYSFDLKFGTGEGRNVMVESAVLWVDEKTKDYLVVWAYKEGFHWGHYLCFCRKGEKEWFEIPLNNDAQLPGCLDMAYKDKKLYIYTLSGYIRILDFSFGGLPIDIPNNPYADRPFKPRYRQVAKFGIKLTTSGDVLMIQRLTKHTDGSIQFIIYKMRNNTEYWNQENLEEALIWELSDSIIQHWERVHSLEEEEALLWDSASLYQPKVYRESRKIPYITVTLLNFLVGKSVPLSFLRGRRSLPMNIQPILHCGISFGDARWFVPCFGAAQ